MSDAAQADLDRLLDTAVRIAKQHLERSSEFVPFALVSDQGGRLMEVELDVSSLGKRPGTTKIEKATVRQLKGMAQTLRCTALTVNTRLSKEKTDALEVRLEHAERAALLVFLPYRRPTFGNIEYGALKVFPGKSEVWSATIS